MINREQILEALKREIDDQTANLNDEDYVELLDELESYVSSCSAATREEMSR